MDNSYYKLKNGLTVINGKLTEVREFNFREEGNKDIKKGLTLIVKIENKYRYHRFYSTIDNIKNLIGKDLEVKTLNLNEKEPLYLSRITYNNKREYALAYNPLPT